MSSPHSNHSDSNYPEDKVTHYPASKHKKVAEFHGNQMSHMMGLMRQHHNAKTRELKKRTK